MGDFGWIMTNPKLIGRDGIRILICPNLRIKCRLFFLGFYDGLGVRYMQSWLFIHKCRGR